MKKTHFARLAKGDKATLSVSAPIYGQYYDVPGKRCFVAPGTQGTIGAAKVPNVTGPEGYFHCLDFPEGTPLVDFRGKPVTTAMKPLLRVAVWANEII